MRCVTRIAHGYGREGAYIYIEEAVGLSNWDSQAYPPFDSLDQ